MGRWISQSCQCQCGDEDPKACWIRVRLLKTKAIPGTLAPVMDLCREKEDYYGVRPLAR